MHILTAQQFSKPELETILALAEKMEAQCSTGEVEKILKDKIVACIFFEPSTRTRLSFESAALRLGAGVIGAENAATNSSASKGETIEDTARIVSGYADIIVMRHPKEYHVEAASKVIQTPIINAGDGANQHPTQALMDVYTIKHELKRLENLHVVFVGDLLNGRTLHSLVPLLSLYSGNKFYFVSPKSLMLPESFKRELTKKNILFEESQKLEDCLKFADVIYMTRVQKERFTDLAEFDKVKNSFVLKPEHLRELKPDSIILHPLPRVNEIDFSVDLDSRAAYFRQAQNGLYVRMAILQYALGTKTEQGTN